MHTTTSRIDPHYVLEAKVFAQCRVDHLNGHTSKWPAFGADIGCCAARSDVIVICEIYIEYELLAERFEGGALPQCFPVARIGSIHRSDFESGGIKFEDVAS